MTSLTYAYRPRAIGGDVIYAIEDDLLVVQSARSLDRIPLRAVERVQVYFQPGNLSRDGYRTFIRFKDGRSTTISNLSFVTFARVDRQDEAYGAFVRDLFRRIAAANPSARFLKGRHRIVWWLTAIAAVTAVAGIGAFTARMVAAGEWQTSLLGAAGLAFAWWQAKPMVVLNRPGTFDPADPPRTLVP